ncbi:MAG: hypothetical protein IPO48_09190 [Saprospiraceae bacterium]|nr:hypothetical protein [Saprospiraceae bacterium]
MTIRLEGVDLFSNIIDLSTTSDVNGNYIFENIKPGSYKVVFDVPANYEFSQAMVNVLTLVSGQQVLTIDAPFSGEQHLVILYGMISMTMDYKMPTSMV